jgi:DHA2 family multidrug resistance protein
MKKIFWLEPRILVAMAVCLLALAEIIDLTIVGVAIPHIMGALGCNIQEISLVTTSYVVSSAIFIMMTGFVSNRFGSKKTILFSAITFGLASVCCGLASSLNEMIIFRILQGIGGAFLPSMAQSYIVSNFNEQERPKMMVFYTLAVVLGPIIGPIMGGYLVEQYNWRCIFWVNVPICLISILLVIEHMQETITSKLTFDILSFSFMTLGFGCLEYFIDEGNNDDWFNSHKLIIILLIGILAISFFIWRGILGKSIVNFSVFKKRHFVVACLICFGFMVIITCSLSFYATLLQQGYNFPVSLAGYITAPRGIFALIGGAVGSKLCLKFDKRLILILGAILFSYACYLEAHYSVDWSMSTQLICCAIQGFAMTLVFIPLMQMVFTGIKHNLSNDAGGVYNFFRNMGSSVGTSLASSLISRQQQVSWNDLSSHLNPFTYPVQASIIHSDKLKQVSIWALQVQHQAFIVANIDVFYLCAKAVLILIIFAVFLDKPAQGMQEISMH